MFEYNGTTGTENYITTSNSATQATTGLTYYSNGSVDPTVTTNWKSSRDGSGTSPANFTAGETFVIENGDNMTTGAVWSISGTNSKLQIESGGTLTATFLVTCASATTFQIDNGGSYVANAAFGSGILGGTEVFGASSNFTYNFAPTGTSTPSSPGYGNLTINTTTNTGNLGWAGTITQVQGNLTVASTGTGAFRHALTAGSATTLAIGGNLVVNGSTALFWLSSGAGTSAVTVTGDVLVSAGTLDLANSTGAGTLNIGGNFAETGGTVKANSAVSTINFTGTGKTFTQSSGTLTNTNINWTVNSGASLTLANDLPVATTRTLTVSGTLDCGTLAVSGAGSVTVASGGTLKVGSTSGSGAINGNITASGGVTLNAGSTVEYNGGGAQFSAARTFDGLKINNSNGVTLLGDITANGTLTLTSGNITTSSNMVTIGSSGSVSRTSGHIIGNLKKNVPTGNSSRTFEVGTGSNYTPIALDFSNVGTAGILTATTAANEHASISGSGLNASKSVNRTWSLTNSGIDLSSGSYDATLTFVASDIDGGADDTKFVVRKYSGSSWSATTTSTRTATTTKATGITSFSDFAAGEQLIDHYSVSASSPQTAGAAFTTTVTAQDVLNETVADDNSTSVTMTSSGSTLFDSNGDATFDDNAKSLTNGVFTISTKDNVAETVTITATDGNTKTGTSTNVVVEPGALHHFTVEKSSGGNIVTQNSGVSFDILVTAQDAGNNMVSSFTGTVDLTTTATSISPTVSGSFVSGQRTESVTLSSVTGGSTTITATKTSSTETGTSNSFTLLGSAVHSTQAGDWSDAATWVQNAVPNLNQDVVIDYAVTLTANTTTKSATIATGGSLITVTYSLSGTGTAVVDNGGTLKVGSLNVSDAVADNIQMSGGLTLNSGSTVEFNGSAAQAAAARTFDGLKINNSNGVTLLSDVTANGTITLSNGSLSIGANTVTINGAVSTTSGSLNGGSSSNIIIGGSGASTTLPAVIVNNLTLNRSNGISLGGDVTSSGTVTLTSGSLSIGANTLTVNGAISTTSGSLTGGSSSNITVGGSGATTTLPTVSLNNLTLNRANGISLGGGVTTNGTLTLTNGALSIGANTLTVNGAISKTSGSVTGGSSSNITFGGSGASTALPAVTLNDLTLNRANGITLGGAVTVNGTLTLTNGNLTTSANTMTLGSTATITGEAIGRYVVGNLATTRTVGAGASQSFGGMGVAFGSGNTNLGTVVMTRISGPGAYKDQQGRSSINRRWKFTAQNLYASNSGHQRSITLTWVNSDDNGRNMEFAKIYRSNSDFVTGYFVASSETNIFSANPRTITGTMDWVEKTPTVNSFTVFSEADAVGPLPVELTSFSGAVQNRKIQLTWSTATEHNNAGFDVERKFINKNGAADAGWSTIGSVQGGGTSNVPLNYHYNDAVSTAGKYLYRLRQTDQSGKSNYHDAIEVEATLSAGDYTLSANYPNPFNPSTLFTFAVKKAETATVKVYNTVGQEVATLFNGIAEPDQLYTLRFDAQGLSSGTYFYILHSDKRHEVKKMMLLK